MYKVVQDELPESFKTGDPATDEFRRETYLWYAWSIYSLLDSKVVKNDEIQTYEQTVREVNRCLSQPFVYKWGDRLAKLLDVYSVWPNYTIDSEGVLNVGIVIQEHAPITKMIYFDTEIKYQ